MFVLIWMTLLISADSGESLKEKQQCSENPSGYCITLPDGEIADEDGLCVDIPCSFTTPSEFTPQSLVWYKCEPTTENCGDSDIIFDSENNNNVQSEFKGRVTLNETDLSKRTCSIMIRDLKESDSGSYQLRVNGVQDGKKSGFTYSLRATLSVEGSRLTLVQQGYRHDFLRMDVPRLILGQQTTITCTAPGPSCFGSDPKFIWSWPGIKQDEYFTASQGRTSTLTFTPSFNHHNTMVTCEVPLTANTTRRWHMTLFVAYAPVEEGKQSCDSGYCVTLPDRDLIAEAGLCVEIPCSFDTPESFEPKDIFWYKCEPSNEKCDDSQVIFETETFSSPSVSLLELDIRMKICTITINGLKKSDSGSYELRLTGTLNGKETEYTFSRRATLLVKALSQKPRIQIPRLIEGEETTLTCFAPGLCRGFPVPDIAWSWSKAGEALDVPDGQFYRVYTSTFTLIPSRELDGAEVTCKVTLTEDVETAVTQFVDVQLTHIGPSETAAWAIVAVSLCVIVFLLILLWNARKKMKSNQEVRMYRSPGDDGSVQPLH